MASERVVKENLGSLQTENQGIEHDVLLWQFYGKVDEEFVDGRKTTKWTPDEVVNFPTYIILRFWIVEDQVSNIIWSQWLDCKMCCS